MKYGIITQYYKSINYGGNLQAYALCMALKKIGIEAEQICYPTRKKKNMFLYTKKSIRERGLIIGIIKGCMAILESNKKSIKLLVDYHQLKKLHEIENKKRQAFSHFSISVIPHSQNVYHDSDLPLLAEKYDGLIVGSDQIWNPDQYRPGYFLEGVPGKGKKIAYAASIAKDKLTDKQKETFAKRISKFNMISVRESNAIDLIKPLTEKAIHFTADPTLLLDVEDWEKVSEKRLIDEPYVFCYFLGKNIEARSLSSEYARTHKFKLAGIPMALNNNVYIDSYDITMMYASPEEFLSGIKYAEVIFTDSFHACVFAHIFSKPFIVFQREKDGRMSNRIDTLMELFRSPELFMRNNGIDSLARIESTLGKFDFTKKTQAEEDLINQSYAFLRQACNNDMDVSEQDM